MGRHFEVFKIAGIPLVIHFKPFFTDKVVGILLKGQEFMKNKLYFIAILYLFFPVSGSLHCIGEKTLKLDSNLIWKMIDYRKDVIQQALVRPNPVLMLSSTGITNGNTVKPAPDMKLSFDEGAPAFFKDTIGHYRTIVSPSLTAVDHRYARAGSGAVLFSGSTGRRNSAADGPLILEAQNSAALFAAGNRIYDFSIEFWLQPLNMENGEQILLWNSVRASRNNTAYFNPQQILCTSVKNRLEWSFLNFFISPDDARNLDITISGVSAVVPKIWSHHLIRFDSATGIVEYLVNGKTEAIVYANSTGREGGEIFTPLTGQGGSFVLGGNFLGLVDEFMIHGDLFPSPKLQKYPSQGGRIQTIAIDLGEGINDVVKIDASGGKTSTINARINNEFRQNGRFRFSDDSELHFFIRASDNPYRWDSPWRPITPGTDIVGTAQGRYVQLMIDFYPSADGEASPYLEELRITYLPDEPPLPPAQLTAVAMDGAVQLQWRNSPDKNTQGYLVYYGTTSDDYFGEDASFGVSPIDVGKINSITIDGLKNGVLYYFRVAAYSHRNSASPGPSYAQPFHTGEFSREVRARPLQTR
jgi:hypothetical protein